MNKRAARYSGKIYNTLVIEELSKRYGVTGYYIRQCIRGTREGLMPETLKNEYHRLDKAVKKALSSNLNTSKNVDENH